MSEKRLTAIEAAAAQELAAHRAEQENAYQMQSQVRFNPSVIGPAVYVRNLHTPPPEKCPTPKESTGTSEEQVHYTCYVRNNQGRDVIVEQGVEPKIDH